MLRLICSAWSVAPLCSLRWTAFPLLKPCIPNSNVNTTFMVLLWNGNVRWYLENFPVNRINRYRIRVALIRHCYRFSIWQLLLLLLFEKMKGYYRRFLDSFQQKMREGKKIHPIFFHIQFCLTIVLQSFFFSFLFIFTRKL